ncbi:hypothetical protein Btru_017478 [Bulinus truncatus]|nr:hypothetical protein Btru_017478 [Bulinus truncatus]
MSSLNLYTDCKNKAIHSKFIPVKGFSKSYLPESYMDQDIAEFVKALADITVKISISFTSPNRPECYPDTDIPYPFNDMWGSGKERVASGWVDMIRKHTGNENLNCPCLKCRSSDSPSKVWGDITVVTATHCVFDRFEVEKSTCRLFYDAEDSSPVVTIGGNKISYSDEEGDRTAFICSTCDVELLEKLSRSLQICAELKAKVASKYEPIPTKGSRPKEKKLTMIVSHPHGCPKHFSFGEWVKKVEDSDSRRRYFYDAHACHGSDGGPVAMLSCLEQPSYYPHSGSVKEKSYCIHCKS